MSNRIVTYQMQAPAELIDQLDAQVLAEGGRLEWPNCPDRQALISRACAEYLERHSPGHSARNKEKAA